MKTCVAPSVDARFHGGHLSSVGGGRFCKYLEPERSWEFCAFGGAIQTPAGPRLTLLPETVMLETWVFCGSVSPMKLNVASVGAGSMPGECARSRGRADLYRNPDNLFFTNTRRFLAFAHGLVHNSLTAGGTRADEAGFQDYRGAARIKMVRHRGRPARCFIAA